MKLAALVALAACSSAAPPPTAPAPAKIQNVAPAATVSTPEGPITAKITAITIEGVHHLITVDKGIDDGVNPLVTEPEVVLGTHAFPARVFGQTAHSTKLLLDLPSDFDGKKLAIRFLPRYPSALAPVITARITSAHWDLKDGSVFVVDKGSDHGLFAPAPSSTYTWRASVFVDGAHVPATILRVDREATMLTSTGRVPDDASLTVRFEPVPEP